MILFCSFQINDHNFRTIGARHVVFGSEVDDIHIASSRLPSVTGVASAHKCDSKSDSCNV